MVCSGGCIKNINAQTSISGLDAMNSYMQGFTKTSGSSNVGLGLLAVGVITGIVIIMVMKK